MTTILLNFEDMKDLYNHFTHWHETTEDIPHMQRMRQLQAAMQEVLNAPGEFEVTLHCDRVVPDMSADPLLHHTYKEWRKHYRPAGTTDEYAYWQEQLEKLCIDRGVTWEEVADSYSSDELTEMGHLAMVHEVLRRIDHFKNN